MRLPCFWGRRFERAGYRLQHAIENIETVIVPKADDSVAMTRQLRAIVVRARNGFARGGLRGRGGSKFAARLKRYLQPRRERMLLQAAAHSPVVIEEQVRAGVDGVGDAGADQRGVAAEVCAGHAGGGAGNGGDGGVQGLGGVEEFVGPAEADLGGDRAVIADADLGGGAHAQARREGIRAAGADGEGAEAAGFAEAIDLGVVYPNPP